MYTGVVDCSEKYVPHKKTITNNHLNCDVYFFQSKLKKIFLMAARKKLMYNFYVKAQSMNLIEKHKQLGSALKIEKFDECVTSELTKEIS